MVNKRNIHLLIIEDNTQIAENLQDMLHSTRNVAFKIHLAYSLPQAILKLENREKRGIQLVILDLQLPDFAGLETFARLKEKAAWVPPVILLTDIEHEDQARELIPHRAQDYLIKSELSAGILERSARYVLELKQMQDALAECEARYLQAVQRMNGEKNAFRDSLTGLPNRALFVDRVGRIVEQARRHTDHLFAVLVLDLDRFKVINDSLGHTFGDKFLVEISHRLNRCLRKGDSVARLGADEFAILLAEISDQEDAVTISERVQEALKAPATIDEQKVTTSASIGIVLGDFHYTYAEELLQDADIAMHQAKMLGKACHAIFAPAMRTRAVERMGLENDLRQAMEDPERLEKELSIAFQPIVDLHNERIVGFEALLRWSHPVRGPIPPIEFIPIAEETGLIHELGMWVIRQACQQVSVWQSWFQKSQPDYQISVNVNISSKQFSRSDLVDRIEAIVQEYQLPPNSLNLEITESFLVDLHESFFQQLEALQKIGINFQVDDFGRGYSSYSALQSFPVNLLKIDSAFIHRLGIEGDNSEIVRSIVGLAKSLGMGVIAEGVETLGQIQKLKEIECPMIQGYYFSKPVNSTKAGKLLLDNWKSLSNP